MTKAKRKVCIWMNDWDSGVWDTGCGNAFSLETGTPRDNGMKYCCYCGEKLEQEFAK